MNDLPFIFYRPRDMFLDTVGMSRDGKVAHRQLADYVWYNDGPPANENDILREITSCVASDWARVKRELIGKGWVETPKFFLHKGIIKTLNYSKKKAVESHNKTAAANRLPRHELLAPDAETGVCSISTFNVTSLVTPVIGEGDRERELEKGEGSERAGGIGEHPTSNIQRSTFNEIPTFEQAFAMTMNAGILKDFCKYVYDDWSSRSGKDGGGNVVSWLPYVTKRWARESVEWRAGTHKGNRSAPSSNSGIDKVVLNRNLTELEASLRRLSEQYEGHQSWSAADIAERKRLKGLVSDVKTKLGIVK